MKHCIQPIKAIQVVAISAMLSLLSMNVDAASLNDPTRPPMSRPVIKTQASAPAGARLTAVLFSDERRVAVIDGKPVREGDRIADAVVTRITSDTVTLTKSQRAEVLRLPKATLSIKTKSAMENRP
jgi:MSHA biogenesis protein MshK